MKEKNTNFTIIAAKNRDESRFAANKQATGRDCSDNKANPQPSL